MNIWTTPRADGTEDATELRYVLGRKESKRAFRQAQGRFAQSDFLVALTSRIAPLTNSEVVFKLGPTRF